MKLIWKTELAVIGQILIWQLLFLVTIITFIVSSKFHNLRLLERKWFTNYYLMFIRHSLEQKETWLAVLNNFC